MPASSLNKPRDRIRIGCGAGYAGDRWEPALECVERGAIDYLVYETLAERTIALGQLEKLRDPARGYNPMLEPRLTLVLRAALARGVRIVSNMGAANPLAAGEAVLRVARELGVAKLRVAVVLGDDVTEQVRATAAPLMRAGSIRVLAHSAAARLRSAPEVPTFAQAGLPCNDASSWNGFLVPAGTPRAVVDKLNAEFVRAGKSPDVAQKMADSGGAVMVLSTPDFLGKFIANEVGRWKRVVQENRIEVE